MESENVHHQHQLHHYNQLLVGSSSSSLPWYGVSSSPHSWTPTNTFNTSEFNNNGALLQPWTNHEGTFNNPSQHKLMLKTVSSSFPMLSQSSEFYPNTHNLPPLPTKGSFSHIYPSINISNLNQASSMEAFDLLSPSRLTKNSSFKHYSSDDHHLNLASFGHSHQQFQLSNQRLACNNSPSKISSSFNTETLEAKRSGNILKEAKASTATKKSRLESRACPPFKVRKEKLGDRIAALQHLVAPYGKTDTASVLMEAIGYIKFLQNQVETLSVPYMKSSRNRTSRSKHGGSMMEMGNEEETRQDLKSRGLCLVPLSCMSYLTTDNGGGGSSGSFWPPPNFSRGI
ncbi:transcription factor bHLH110-like isoform X1 [Gossypium arboreum]|uniref:transcription factor bHLH110-like isoform X1 n=1 Tax=Gossypium arboreum TaxID=29729 RepID=UPI0008197A04|nr:transcription factor bHLH110-like isoform X1 [Gossypium arboreum]